MSLDLAYRETGSGAPLVMLHGLFGSAANWGVVARALADQCRVYSLDLRNHGKSPHAATMTYPEMAGDVLAFLEARSLEKSVVLGHSMGGKVAMQLALHAPERVRALILVDIAPVRYDNRRFDFIAALRRLDTGAIASREEADAALAAAIPDDSGRRFLLTNLQARPDGAWHWRLNLDAIAGGIKDLLDFPDPGAWAAFRGPTLFLAGAESACVRPEHEPKIRQFFPNAVIQHLPDVGHNPHTEAPETAIAAVREFLTNTLEAAR